MTKKAEYLIPSKDGTKYEKVHFETSASMVVEDSGKRFVSKDQKDFFDKNMKQIILEEDIQNGFSSKATNKPASAKDVYDLKQSIGDAVIIISKTQPKPQPGKTIIWIEE